MRVAIIGSRGYSPLANVSEYVNGLPDDTVVVSGGAVGVDTTAEVAARKRGLIVEVHLPEYRKYGRSAPIIRNDAIVRNADLVVAFWTGNSPGTRNALDRAKRLGKPVEVRQ